eukprot:CAMPEP_0115393822 /NCGR_PEP_ID=MMETSP0271-20121206/11949_1 /TAXON_ID=71861 /ORGANISM="Scrippsiella trochoidea, Strain CCMP3099" /LENGTH=479 /DNA_ID=CAMNT_0002817475 /DNA_START=9 /DNA_END=1448 /DNA_ORIENTATION=+
MGRGADEPVLGSSLLDHPSSAPHPSEKALGLWSLVALAFFWISGGIYGNEVLAEAAPPGYVLAGLIMLPLAYSLPAALVAAELGTAFPEDGGIAVWAQEAFGSSFGGHVAFWMWFACLLDAATYPGLAVDFLGQSLPVLRDHRATTSVAFVTGIALVRLRGLRETTAVSALFAVAATLPVVCYILLGAQDLDLEVALSIQGTTNWRLLTSWMMWTFTGVWSLGSLAGQVDQPQAVYPKLAAILVTLLVVQNVVPMAISFSQEPDTSSFRVGFLAVLAQRVGGPGLGLAFQVSAWLCQLGTCNASSMTADRVLSFFMESRLPSLGFGCGIKRAPASCGWWVFDVQEETGIRPAYTLWNAAIVCLMSIYPAKAIVSSEMILLSVVAVTGLLAFLSLKIHRPGLERAYVVPGGLPGSIALVSFPLVVLSLQLTLSLADAAYTEEGRDRLLGIACVVLAGVFGHTLALWYLARTRGSGPRAFV